MLIGIVAVAGVLFGVLTLFSWLGSRQDPTSTTVAVIVDDTAETTTGVVTAPTDRAPTSEATPTVGSSSTAPADTAPETTTTQAEVVEPRDPAEVTVKVLNAVGVAGLAAQVTDALDSAGYQVQGPDDYEPLLDRTQVLFREGFGPEAFELAGLEFPDAEVGQNPDANPPADILVLLGASYEAG
jgi:hypothetical protein